MSTTEPRTGRRYRIHVSEAQLRDDARLVMTSTIKHYPGIEPYVLAYRYLSNLSKDPKFYYSNAQLAAVARGIDLGLADLGVADQGKLPREPTTRKV